MAPRRVCGARASFLILARSLARPLVSRTQVVRYGNPKAWFKPHLDVYHNWPGWPSDASSAAQTPAAIATRRFERWVQALVRAWPDAGALPGGVMPCVCDHFELLLVKQLLDSAVRWSLVVSAASVALTTASRRAGARAQQRVARVAARQLRPPIDGPVCGAARRLAQHSSWFVGIFCCRCRCRRCLCRRSVADAPRACTVAQALWRSACGTHASCQADDAAGNASEAAAVAAAVPVKRVIPNRHVTVFSYLNDVSRGGETVFPLVRVATCACLSCADRDSRAAQARRTLWNGTDDWQVADLAVGRRRFARLTAAAATAGISARHARVHARPRRSGWRARARFLDARCFS